MMKRTYFIKAKSVVNEDNTSDKTEFGEEVTIDLGSIEDSIKDYAEDVMDMIDSDDCEECEECDCDTLDDASNKDIESEARSRGMSMFESVTDIVGDSLIKRFLNGFDTINRDKLDKFLDENNM
jgi:hypothetical protein